MTGSTASGLPYPTGGDALQTIDDQVKALADALEAWHKRGSDAVPIVAAATPGSVNITFGTPYAVGVTPRVFVTYAGVSVSSQIGLSVTNQSRTGFTVNGIRQTGTSNIPFDWHAIPN